MPQFNLLEEYHQELGKNFVLELCKTFLESSPQKIKLLHQCIQNNEVQTFTRTAHSLKSNAKTFDANTLADLFYTLETQSKTAPLASLIPTLTQAEKEYTQLTHDLKAFLIRKYQ